MALRSKHSLTARPGIPGAEKNPAQVHDHTDASSITHEACSTFHEVGHLFGAPDHYKTGRTTSALNGLISGGYFSQNCIYGESHLDEAVTNSMTVCEGCRKAIRKEIIIPASWFEGGYLS